MLSEVEILKLRKLAEKNPEVEKLLGFYEETQEDGVQKLSISLNRKLCIFSEQIDNADLNITSKEDKVAERVVDIMEKLGKIAQSLKTINNREEEPIKTKKGHENKVTL